MNKVVLFLAAITIFASCKPEKRYVLNQPVEFDTDLLNEDMHPVKGASGQLLYLPVYSNIPFLIDTGMFDMSAFVAIHNTDLNHQIILSRVLYFNSDGKLVDDFLKNNNEIIMPLATRNFYIPYEDKSGTGANFLVEWTADTIVSEPLIESVTLCLKPNNTVAILSQGKIVREK